MSWEQLSFFLTLAFNQRNDPACSPILREAAAAAGGLTLRVVWDENRYLFARVGRAMGDGLDAWERGRGREESDNDGSWNVVNMAANGGLPEGAARELQQLFDNGGEGARARMRERAREISYQAFADTFARHLSSRSNAQLQRLFRAATPESLDPQEHQRLRHLLYHSGSIHELVSQEKLAASVLAALTHAGDLADKPSVDELRARIALPVARALLKSDA
jgi:hypothetical protein